MKLPHTPRIGEKIDLRFLEGWYFTHGHVHEIQHEIDGATQKIVVYIHPLNNYAWKWKRLKEEVETDARWRRSLNDY